MKYLLVLVAVILLASCDNIEPAPNPTAQITPTLLFVDENGVKVYAFIYDARTRCYAVGASMCQVANISGAKVKTYSDPDAPTVEAPPESPKQRRIRLLEQELRELRSNDK